MTTPILPDPLPLPPELTAEDVARAKQAWRDAVPPEFRNLLDAEARNEAQEKPAH